MTYLLCKHSLDYLKSKRQIKEFADRPNLLCIFTLTFITSDTMHLQAMYFLHGGLLTPWSPWWLIVPLQGFRINGRTATYTAHHSCVIDISSTVAITQKLKMEESKEKMCLLTARTRFTVYQYAVFLFIFSRSYLLSRL